MYNYRTELDYYNYENNNYNKPMYTKNENPNMLYDPYNGFIRGNMFPDLYNDYKIEPVEFKISNEKEQLSNKICNLCFATHDINLYLDLYPDDRDMLNLYNSYKKEVNGLLPYYEEKYGQLFVGSTTKYPFEWIKEP